LKVDNTLCMKKSEANKQSRLAREREKLDKLEEQSFAEIGFASKTDWESVKLMKDEEIDFADCPEVSSEMFVNGIVRRGNKTQINKS
jgi:hypothetical protein